MNRLLLVFFSVSLCVVAAGPCGGGGRGGGGYGPSGGGGGQTSNLNTVNTSSNSNSGLTIPNGLSGGSPSGNVGLPNTGLDGNGGFSSSGLQGGQRSNIRRRRNVLDLLVKQFHSPNSEEGEKEDGNNNTTATTTEVNQVVMEPSVNCGEEGNKNDTNVQETSSTEDKQPDENKGEENSNKPEESLEHQVDVADAGKIKNVGLNIPQGGNSIYPNPEPVLLTQSF